MNYRMGETKLSKRYNEKHRNAKLVGSRLDQRNKQLRTHQKGRIIEQQWGSRTATSISISKTRSAQGWLSCGMWHRIEDGRKEVGASQRTGEGGES